ncbi:MAG: Asp-tRNA(Asn)/Glu-tRNA(Gln) amidotransferase GatCAB subunit A [Alphaproteobacteria bacterium CG_4_10_14_0_8_um_filter_37_21]|nr:MAG: Asp-tRNA(Asn)/Glu-tRNA(Gln) amidotransferase GatCAB subunit A [Alphaproteobacteria bacterium CG_4_10_14_0_8_um_filter_37_21]
MTILTQLTISKAKALLTKGEISSKDLVQAHVDAMELKKDLNAFLTPCSDDALKKAERSDTMYKNKTARALEGIPLAYKDNFCTKNVRTTCGSKILANFVPPYEATVTDNLNNQGAINLGKLNMDEFAMGSGNIHSAYGPVTNPWKSKEDPSKKLVPGGSSGGSAASVSAHITMGALGSDTGGSIRQPASFCGIVGIKPTYGLCSRYGMIAFASSLDQAGPLARTVEDTALILQHMAGFDPKDATSIDIKIPEYAKNINKNIKGLKVGVPIEYLEGLHPDGQELVQKGIEWLKAEGAEVKEISLKTTSLALPAYYIIAPAEASSNLARFDGARYGERVKGDSLDEMYANTREEGFGKEVKRRIMIGTYVLSAGYYDAFYTKALKIKHLITEDFNKAFHDVDVLLTPTTPTAAFGIDEKITDPVTMYLNDVYTATANLAGIPGISVPAGLDHNGLPLGLQLLGPRFSEQSLFNIASVIEDAAQFKGLED